MMMMAFVSAWFLILAPLIAQEGLGELVGFVAGRAAHVLISDGRFLDLKLYSILPGSTREKNQRHLITVTVKGIYKTFEEGAT